MRRDISMEEVARHRTQDDAWLVYNGKVRLLQHVSPQLRSPVLCRGCLCA